MPLSDDAIARLRDDELLDHIIEEAAEVIQAATKAKRFGLDGSHPNRSDRNGYEIALESAQLSKLVHTLSCRQGIRLRDVDDDLRRRAKATDGATRAT